METPNNIISDRYVSNYSLRDTHSQSIKLEGSSLQCSDNTESGVVTGNRTDTNRQSDSNSGSAPKVEEENKESDLKSKLAI